MSKKTWIAIAGAVLAAGTLVSAPALAGPSIHVQIGTPAPYYYTPAPSYYYAPQVQYSSGYYYAPQHRGRHRRDSDRDGIPNRFDRDRDNDGVPNRFDRRPNNPYRY
jgi:hypothetical protein